MNCTYIIHEVTHKISAKSAHIRKSYDCFSEPTSKRENHNYEFLYFNGFRSAFEKMVITFVYVGVFS